MHVQTTSLPKDNILAQISPDYLLLRAINTYPATEVVMVAVKNDFRPHAQYTQGQTSLCVIRSGPLQLQRNFTVSSSLAPAWFQLPPVFSW
jgi:hypothetical protein